MDSLQKPSASDIAAIHKFMLWGSKHIGFPYGSISYWEGAYSRGDGKDECGNIIPKR